MQVLIDLIKAAAESQSALVVVLLIFSGGLYALAWSACRFVKELRGSIKGHRDQMGVHLNEMLTEFRRQSIANTEAVRASNEGLTACTEAIQALVTLLQRESRHHPANVLHSLDNLHGLHPKVDELLTLSRATGTRVMELCDELSRIREDLARMERETLAGGVRSIRGGAA